MVKICSDQNGQNGQLLNYYYKFFNLKNKKCLINYSLKSFIPTINHSIFKRDSSDQYIHWKDIKLDYSLYTVMQRIKPSLCSFK